MAIALAPSTTLKLYKQVPLDPTYKDTLWFENAAAQTAYFDGQLRFSFSDQSYTRISKGVMRVQGLYEDLINANYCSIENYDGAWKYYCFITQMDYINNNTTDIHFQIDVMQTYMFYWVLMDTFVVREHTAVDWPGYNLVPEDIELGDYMCEPFPVGDTGSNMSILLATTFNKNFEDYNGGFYAGVYSGLCFHVFPNTVNGAALMQNFIDQATEYNKADGIIGANLIPTAAIYNGNPESNIPNFGEVELAPSNTLQGYVPRNKKLLTYPYQFIYLTNLQGNSAVFPYEYFYDAGSGKPLGDPTGPGTDSGYGGECKFRQYYDISVSPSVVTFPLCYKRSTYNWDEKMILSGFPQIPLNTDSFKAWWAQNSGTTAVNALALGAKAMLKIGSAFAGSPVASMGANASSSSGGLGDSAVYGLIDTFAQAGQMGAQIYERSTEPPQVRGAAGASSMAAFGMMRFQFYHKHIQYGFALIIDKYFDMFGYAKRNVKKPSIHVRKRYTYTKTIGCRIGGNVPAQYKAQIERIFDNGITFWADTKYVGFYPNGSAELDNPVL